MTSCAGQVHEVATHPYRAAVLRERARRRAAGRVPRLHREASRLIRGPLPGRLSARKPLLLRVPDYMPND